jgi:tRNA A37 threonylcarbamoyladenosine synthetase subunit TsaC/SUA5/YrdC
VRRFYNIDHDAAAVFEVVKKGGIAIIPGSLGYAIVGSSYLAMETINRTKRRRPEKIHGFTGNRTIEKEVHETSSQAQEFIRAVTEDFDLPLGVVAPVRLDHPIIRNIDSRLLPLATRDGTINIVLNGGQLLESIARLCEKDVFPMFGSSANISTSGVKARIEDIEPEIIQAADLVIDYGVARWYEGGRSSTILDVRDFSVVRYGVSYGQIADIARRHFGIQLPEDPSIRWPGTPVPLAQVTMGDARAKDLSLSGGVIPAQTFDR